MRRLRNHVRTRRQPRRSSVGYAQHMHAHRPAQLGRIARQRAVAPLPRSCPRCAHPFPRSNCRGARPGVPGAPSNSCASQGAASLSPLPHSPPSTGQVGTEDPVCTRDSSAFHSGPGCGSPRSNPDARRGRAPATRCTGRQRLANGARAGHHNNIQPRRAAHTCFGLQLPPCARAHVRLPIPPPLDQQTWPNPPHTKWFVFKRFCFLKKLMFCRQNISCSGPRPMRLRRALLLLLLPVPAIAYTVQMPRPPALPRGRPALCRLVATSVLTLPYADLRKLVVCIVRGAWRVARCALENARVHAGALTACTRKRRRARARTHAGRAGRAQRLESVPQRARPQ